MRTLEFDDDLMTALPDEEVEGCSEEVPEIADTGDALIPNCGMEDDEVERLSVPYSTRAPGDWVSSGPLGPAWTDEQLAGIPKQRHFSSWEAAEVWARRFYKMRFKGRVPEAQREGCNRWAFLIKRSV